jgi:hypothetical protein
MTFADWKAAVYAALTDRKPSDVNFAAAVADYVRGRIARDLRNDVPTYGMIEKRYTALRRGLIGYQTTLNDATLQANVKALLRVGVDDNVFAQAAAEWVRSQAGDPAALARYATLSARLAGFQTALSDADLRTAVKGILRAGVDDNLFAQAVAEYVRAQSGDTAALPRYAALQQRLAGYQTTLDDTTLQTNVKALLRTGADVNLFTAAVAEYIRARIDGKPDPAADARYAALKARLAGYQTSLTGGQVSAAVTVLLTDGPRDNATFAQACALYVRAYMAREIDARNEEATAQVAMATAASCQAEFERMRIRLLGFTYTGASLVTDVGNFLPIDSQRLVATPLFNTLVANAQTALTAFSTWFGGMVTQAIYELEDVNTWQNAQIAAAQSDLQTIDTWQNAQITIAKSDLQTVDTWVNAQIATAKDDLQSLRERVDLEIIAGAADLQQYVRAFQLGHQSTLTESDVVADGQVCTGYLPSESQLREARLRCLNDPNGNDDWAVQMTEGQVALTAGVAVPISSTTLTVFTLTLLADDSNAGEVLAGYGSQVPLQPLPLVLPLVPGRYYDLSQVMVKGSVTGDKATYSAPVFNDQLIVKEHRCEPVNWDSRHHQIETTHWFRNLPLNPEPNDRWKLPRLPRAPQLAIDPKGSEFMLGPGLKAGQFELLLVYDTIKRDYGALDQVPFDADSARAVSLFVNAALSGEWGEALAQKMAWRGDYESARTRLYLKYRGRTEVRP